MKKILSCILIMYLSIMIINDCALILLAAQDDKFFTRDNTVIFAVGILKWKRSDIYSSFPEKNRKDEMLIEYFRNMGVPENKIFYLKNEKAGLKDIKLTLAKAISKCAKNDTLLIYYCGHGFIKDTTDAYFVNYDAGDTENEGWSINSIFEALDKDFNGSKVLLAADCCHSGYLCQAASASKKKQIYACFASSLAREQSTGNWTFTEKFVEGLMGMRYIDADSDGYISMAELGESISCDMAFAEGQLSSSYFGDSIKGSSAFAKAESGKFAGPEKRIEAYSAGNWYKARITDTADNKFKVHYFGWDYSCDEFVTEDKIREFKQPVYETGASVDVKWQGKWYPAKIVRNVKNIYYIHYDDYDDLWDEWTGADRIRNRKK